MEKYYHIDIIVSEGTYPHIQSRAEFNKSITVTPNLYKRYKGEGLSDEEIINKIIVSMLA